MTYKTIAIPADVHEKFMDYCSKKCLVATQYVTKMIEKEMKENVKDGK